MAQWRKANLSLFNSFGCLLVVRILLVLLVEVDVIVEVVVSRASSIWNDVLLRIVLSPVKNTFGLGVAIFVSVILKPSNSKVEIVRLMPF